MGYFEIAAGVVLFALCFRTVRLWVVEKVLKAIGENPDDWR